MATDDRTGAWKEWDLPVDGRGLALRVCDWGGASHGVNEPPIVVLHGFLEQGAAWDGVARGLGAALGGRRVVAPDQRGHGLSGHVGAGGWYHFWDYVGDLDALVAELGGVVDLIGHSMGGTVACLFAGARPDAVRRLVLVDGLGPPDMSADVVGRARRYLDDRRRPPEHAPIADAEAAADRMRRYNPGIDEQVARRLAARTTRPDPRGGVSWTWDALHRGRAPTSFDGRVFEQFLAEIRAPVLSVVGGRSSFVFDAWASREAAIRAPLRKVVLPDAGHLVHHDDPDGLVACVAPFVAAQAAAHGS